VRTTNVNLEVVSIPVSDVDKALGFYRDQLGWRVDADINGDQFRIVQITPTGDGHVSIVSAVVSRWPNRARCDTSNS
jgi:catechol 2,3-dioxygenase-like lactoylglutathione lyase family enzyme